VYAPFGTYFSFLDDCLLSRLDCSNKKNNKYQLLYPNIVPPDGEPRYGGNM